MDSNGGNGTGTGPLAGFRVVEVSTGIAGGYAGKLFVDAGAEVVKVEPIGGDPLRRWSATGGDTRDRPSPLFTFLAAGKRSVEGEPDDPAVAELIAGADLVIESGEVDPGGLRAKRPELVVVSITPFGRTGPLADRPASDFIVQAECGSIAARGVPERPPVQAGARTSEWGAGLYGAAAGLAALTGVRHGGSGAAIDVSWIESMVLCTNLFADPMWSLMKELMGIDPIGLPRSVETPSIYPTSDGWIGFNTNGPQHAQAFLELIERPDLLEAGYDRPNVRTEDRIRFDGWVREWTTAHTTAEILRRAGELRVPTVRVNDAASVLEDEHLVARGFFAANDDDSIVAPRPHYLIDGRRPTTGARPPALDADRDLLHRARAGSDRTATTGPAPSPGRPLEGLKVLDITCWWAGPSNTHLLAAMGADVIHVESIKHLDPMRFAAAVMFLDRDRWWELSSFYLCINSDKRGITLDLGDPRGVELAEQLVEWADIVVENYTPRVMPKFGLGWDRVHELNPRAVMVRQPAFGLDGPWADRLGFAQNMEQMAGMAFLTGYADQEPLVPRGPCDPLGGAHAAFATLVGLAHRERTGTGVLVEVPLIEGALNITAEPVVEYSAFGRIMQREGNRSAHAAPQGLYRCRGEEQWVAISVVDDEQWTALAELLDDEELRGDAALQSHEGRRLHHDRLDLVIDEWTRHQSVDEVVGKLVAVGVPVAAVADQRTIHTHPHIAARGFFEVVPHPVVGELPVLGLPFRVSDRERLVETPAPTVGQHNAEVLGGLLGLDAETFAALAADGVIGERPFGS